MYIPHLIKNNDAIVDIYVSEIIRLIKSDEICKPDELLSGWQYLSLLINTL